MANRSLKGGELEKGAELPIRDVDDAVGFLKDAMRFSVYGFGDVWDVRVVDRGVDREIYAFFSDADLLAFARRKRNERCGELKDR